MSGLVADERPASDAMVIDLVEIAMALSKEALSILANVTGAENVGESLHVHVHVHVVSVERNPNSNSDGR